MNHLKYCEFYITNVCNLSCNGCNRFNNYNFRGFQRWNDYKDLYAEWSKELQISSIGILGGEPLLNVDFKLWVQGIRQLWPQAAIKVTTNGFYLDKVSGLYDLVRANRIKLEIGIHNKTHKAEILEKVKEFLVAPLHYEFNNSDPYQEHMFITDANNLRVKVEYNWWFHQGTLIPQNDQFTLHQSDVETAHNNCHMKTCHHFIRGKLYKCGVVALLPEFAEQHVINITPEDRELMTGYRPLEITDSQDIKKKFVDNIEKSIPQCRFCPEQYHGDQIWAQHKRNLK